MDGRASIPRASGPRSEAHRLGSVVLIWLTVLLAFAAGILRRDHVAAASTIGAGMLVASVASLLVFPRIRKATVFTICSILDNTIAVCCYTCLVYALGGVEVIFLVAIHCIFISYVGVLGSVRVPYALAAASALGLWIMAFLEHNGTIASYAVTSRQALPWANQILVLAAATLLLFVVAFISAFVRDLLVRGWEDIKGRTRALEEATERALTVDRLKSQFLANASHELRTPLNHILGFSQLLQDPRTGPLNASQREYLGDVASSARLLLSLIDDLLDLTTLQAAKMAAQWREIDLDAGEAPRTITADERRLRQVLLNLLSNALKFTARGGHVTLRGTFQEIGSSSGDGPSVGQPDAVHVSVRDDGIGMEPEFLGRVFLPFERSRASSRANIPGTGLGLALSRELVALHGGRMWAESAGLGHGTTVHFAIPLRPSTQGKQPWSDGPGIVLLPRV